MCSNNGEANHESVYDEGADGGKEDDDDSEEYEAGEGFTVGELAAQDDQRRIGWAEKVEKEPSGQEEEEGQEREGVREEG